MRRHTVKHHFLPLRPHDYPLSYNSPACDRKTICYNNVLCFPCYSRSLYITDAGQAVVVHDRVSSQSHMFSRVFFVTFSMWQLLHLSLLTGLSHRIGTTRVERRELWRCLLFTALHGMQTRSSDENSVCLSVCQTRALWQNGRKLGLDFYILWKKTFILVFWEGEWLVGPPLLPEILGQPARVGAKSPILNR